MKWLLSFCSFFLVLFLLNALLRHYLPSTISMKNYTNLSIANFIALLVIFLSYVFNKKE